MSPPPESRTNATRRALAALDGLLAAIQAETLARHPEWAARLAEAKPRRREMAPMRASDWLVLLDRRAARERQRRS